MSYRIMDLKDKQKTSMEILVYVAEFCESKNIRYYLAYGTLLGAIRHRGFIPWDDDIDLFLPRPDYDRFLSEFVTSSNYELVSCLNRSDYVFPYAKVINRKTKMLLSSGKIIDLGLGIDLFPIDGIPDDYDISEAEKIFINKNKVFLDFVQRIDAYKYITPSSLKDYIKKGLYRVTLSLGVLRNKGQLISTNPYNSDYDRCSKVAPVVGVYYGKFLVFNKEWFNPMSIEFEGHTLVAPSGYDYVLTMIYSNYMELPPQEERMTTHIANYIWI